LVFISALTSILMPVNRIDFRACSFLWNQCAREYSLVFL